MSKKERNLDLLSMQYPSKYDPKRKRANEGNNVHADKRASGGDATGGKGFGSKAKPAGKELRKTGPLGGSSA